MSKLTDEQIQKIQQNLKVGTCPNCGYEGDKTLIPEEMSLVSLDANSKREVDINSIGSFPAPPFPCPRLALIQGNQHQE